MPTRVLPLQQRLGLQYRPSLTVTFSIYPLTGVDHDTAVTMTLQPGR